MTFPGTCYVSSHHLSHNHYTLHELFGRQRAGGRIYIDTVIYLFIYSFETFQTTISGCVCQGCIVSFARISFGRLNKCGLFRAAQKNVSIQQRWIKGRCGFCSLWRARRNTNDCPSFKASRFLPQPQSVKQKQLPAVVSSSLSAVCMSQRASTQP